MAVTRALVTWHGIVLCYRGHGMTSPRADAGRTASLRLPVAAAGGHRLQSTPSKRQRKRSARLEDVDEFGIDDDVEAAAGFGDEPTDSDDVMDAGVCLTTW